MKKWTPGNFYTWDFSDCATSVEYFIKRIKPKLSAEQVKGLEELAAGIKF